MIFASWNVNGLRSVSNKGFEVWFRENSPDVIALQEIKANQEDVESLILKWSDLYNVHLFSAVKKGYSGTALLIKKTLVPKSVEKGIGIEEYDNEGRLIYVEFENVALCIFAFYHNISNL